MDNRDHPYMPTEEEMEDVVHLLKDVVESDIHPEHKVRILEAVMTASLMRESERKEVLVRYTEAAIEMGVVDVEKLIAEGFIKPKNDLH